MDNGPYFDTPWVPGGVQISNERNIFYFSICAYKTSAYVIYEWSLSKPVNIKCPVRIMHGLEDTEISFTQTLELCQSITTKDVDLIIRKNGPHQLDQPHDIEIFLNTLDRMLKDHPVES